MIRDLGHRLKLSRVQKRMAQKTVADMLDINRTTMSAYETGANTPPPEVLMKLASLYNVSVDYLLGIDTKPTLQLDGLSDIQIEAVKATADAFRETNKLIPESPQA